MDGFGIIFFGYCHFYEGLFLRLWSCRPVLIEITFAPARVAPDTKPEIDSLSVLLFLFLASVVALLLLLLDFTI